VVTFFYYFTSQLTPGKQHTMGQRPVAELPKLALADMHTTANKTILRKFFLMVSFLFLNKFEYLSR